MNEAAVIEQIHIQSVIELHTIIFMQCLLLVNRETD